MGKHWVIAAGLALGAVLGACSSSSSKAAPPATAAATTTTATPTTVATTTTTTAAASAALVSVAANPQYGQLLVGAGGRTLYLFEKDTGTTTACTGGCAAVWPALAASGTPTGGPGVDSSKLSTANGQVPNQVVYNGHLLYYFKPDTAAGDVKGINIPNWFPVSPAGNKITKP